MEIKRKYSILYPNFGGSEYNTLSETTFHDLALDVLCQKVGNNYKESAMIKNVISEMTRSPRVAQFRQKVFCDILKSPDLRAQMVKIFDKFEFIRNYGVNHLKADEKVGIWHLMRRMDELSDYISCVEAIQECLSKNSITSEGLKGLKKHVDELYHDANFAEKVDGIFSGRSNSHNVIFLELEITIWNNNLVATHAGAKKDIITKLCG